MLSQQATVLIALVSFFLAGSWLVFGAHRPTEREPQQVPAAFATLAAQMERAGWSSLSPRAVVVGWVGVSVLVGAVVWVVWPIAVLALLSSLASLFLGRAILRSSLSSRERRLRAAWPDVVDHIRQAVRSGAGVAEAVSLTAPRVPEEIRPPFLGFVGDLERGFRVDQALTHLKRSLANPVADRIVEALRMANDVGGRELPIVLESLQTSIRSDVAVREEAMAKQSWIRAASKLGVSAPWLVLVVISGRPETISAYSSTEGSLLLIAGAGASVLAYRMMAKLGRLPDDRRWFQS